jgi:hypothetical protein
MRRKYYLFICLAMFFQFCAGQTAPKKEFYSKDFKWRITIPENFETISNEEMDKLKNKGAEAIEKTYDEKIDPNGAKVIFMFRSDKMNYFESNYQAFDVAVDGDYLESTKNVCDILYNTFMTQMPGVKVDTTRTVEKIDNLPFQTFKMRIEYPNKMVLHGLMYSRLFDKKEFSVNIMYVDEEKGKVMIDAWKTSKFGK